MIDHGPVTEPEATLAVRDEAAAPPPAFPSLPELEERLRRLEDAVASLQETTRRPEEPRTDGIAAVSERQAAQAAPAPAEGSLADAGRGLLPLAWNLLRPPPPEAIPVTPAAEPVARSQTWLVWEAYEDFRCIFRMFFDRRYRVRWSALLVPVGIVFVMLFSWMFIGGIWVVGPFIDKVIDLVLAFLAYKVLVREAHRYRAAVAHLPSYSRR